MNKPRKVFWHNPYLTVWDAAVSSRSHDEITLDGTIFFAESGGQESDHGSIGGFPVREARKVGPDIVYRLPSEHSLVVGDRVEVRIDWTRRYRLMRLHFAAEIVLELLVAELHGVQKIGAHIAADKARIDFAWPQSITPVLADVEAAANELVRRDVAITSGFEDEANERRFWEIGGFARVACGGTHLRRTGEIGTILLKRDNVGRGKERVVIRVDERPTPPADSHTPLHHE